MMNFSDLRARTLAASAVFVPILMATGCGSEVASVDTTASPTPIVVNSEAVEDAWSLVHYDYDALPTWAALQAESELVFSGSVLAIDEGRIQDGQSLDDPGAVRHALMSVQVDVAVHGDSSSGDTIYVELVKGGASLEKVREAIPAGTPVVLYLVEATNEDAVHPYGDDFVNRPENSVLWMPYTPQGFIIGYDESGDPLLPLDAGSSLEDELANESLGELLPE